MDRRLVLSIIILLASVLLLAGLMNFQAGSAEESPDDSPAPLIEEPETIQQKASSSNDNTPKEIKEIEQEPEEEFFMGGGGATPSTTAVVAAKAITTADVPGPILSVGFESNVTSGLAPLNVQFTDNSTGSPNAWYWDFGDGTNSTTQNPLHMYVSPGIYAVYLTVATDENADRSTGDEWTNDPYYITVLDDSNGARVPINTDGSIPEFPTIAIPMVAIIGMAFFFGRKQ